MNTDGEHKNPGDSDPPHRGSIVTALTPRESDNDNGKKYKYLCIITYQPDTKSNPNPKPSLILPVSSKQ